MEIAQKCIGETVFLLLQVNGLVSCPDTPETTGTSSGFCLLLLTGHAVYLPRHCAFQVSVVSLIVLYKVLIQTRGATRPVLPSHSCRPLHTLGPPSHLNPNLIHLFASTSRRNLSDAKCSKAPKPLRPQPPRLDKTHNHPCTVNHLLLCACHDCARCDTPTCRQHVQRQWHKSLGCLLHHPRSRSLCARDRGKGDSTSNTD